MGISITFSHCLLHNNQHNHIIMTISTSSSLHATSVSWQESSPTPSLVVELAGSFSNWSPLPMTRSDKGIWTSVLELECGRHEYKLIVDGDWRVDESVEKVNNDMGSHNNVLHVEEDEAEQVEETRAEECKNEEINLTVKDETDVEEERNEEVNEADVDQDITTESKDEEKRETAPKPNFVMTRAVAIEQKMRDLEEGVENLMLNSPVRVTRGKLKKFVQEKDSTPAKC